PEVMAAWPAHPDPSKKMPASIVVERKISTQKASAISTYRVLKFCGTRFRVSDRRISTSSDYIKKLIARGKCPVVISLDHLKERQPYLTSDGIANAIDYANGCAIIPQNKVVESLAASNALQMWEMYEEISGQLVSLASMPQSAPFVIAIANADVISTSSRNTIYELASQIVDEAVTQPTFPLISLCSLKVFINFLMGKMLNAANVDNKKAIAKSIAKALVIWLEGRSDAEREHFQEIFDKIQPYREENIVNNLVTPNESDEFMSENEISVKTSAAKVYALDKKSGDVIEDYWPESELDIVSSRQPAGASETQLNHKCKTYVFHGAELPPVAPDANGVRNYRFVIEFETTKEFLSTP
uniref:Thioredoxin domain-containing protein n=2 Tax=Parascaris univalens TaxID=6257 RepID=A0A915BPW9_PARUN